MNIQNVFIAGLPRGGTTLLGMILQQHPEIFHIGESFYWGRLLSKNIRCSCGVRNCSFLNKVETRIFQDSLIKEIRNFCSAIDMIEEPDKVRHETSLEAVQVSNKKQLAETLVRACAGMNNLADIFREESKSPIIVDNSKTIHLCDGLLDQGWKILLLARDPRGMAYSNKKAGFRKGVLRRLENKIPVYLNFANKAIDLIGKENVLFLRYEDLCANPEMKLRKICDFLEINFSIKMLNFKHDRGHTLMGNHMRFDENQSIKQDLEWKKGLTKKELTIIKKNSELILAWNFLGYNLFE